MEQAALSPFEASGCAVDDGQLLNNTLLVAVEQACQLGGADCGVETEEAAHVWRWEQRLDVGLEEVELVSSRVNDGWGILVVLVFQRGEGRGDEFRSSTKEQVLVDVEKLVLGLSGSVRASVDAVGALAELVNAGLDPVVESEGWNEGVGNGDHGEHSVDGLGDLVCAGCEASVLVEVADAAAEGVDGIGPSVEHEVAEADVVQG